MAPATTKGTVAAGAAGKGMQQMAPCSMCAPVSACTTDLAPFRARVTSAGVCCSRGRYDDRRYDDRRRR